MTSNSKAPRHQETTPDCAPTYVNLWVGDTVCGCKVFETVLSGIKRPVDRRPTDTERADVIKSGHVFVYKEKDNGIKRWTDGLHWSPSRISGNFLVYRELPGPFPPGHKKKAIKRKSNGDEQADDMSMQQSNDGSDNTSLASAPQTPLMTRTHPSRQQEGVIADKRKVERSLYGSLTKSYEFKQDGLMKKTMSVRFEGQPYHLVAYYNPKDVERGILKDSNGYQELMDVKPRSALLFEQPWRAPLEGSNASPTVSGATSPRNAPNVDHIQSPLPHQAHQPQYGYTQHAVPYAQHAYGQPAAFVGVPFSGMHMAAPSAYYPVGPYPTYSGSEGMPPSAMSPTVGAPSYPAYSMPYGYSGVPAATYGPLMSPTVPQELQQSLPSPPASRGHSGFGYAVLPSQNPRRADGSPYVSQPQYHQPTDPLYAQQQNEMHGNDHGDVRQMPTRQFEPGRGMHYAQVPGFDRQQQFTSPAEYEERKNWSHQSH